MTSVALLGDSVFDNSPYIGDEPDVAEHLRRLLPQGSTVTLCAVDGSVVDNIAGQAAGIPRETTHIALSVGGNDALMNSEILHMPVTSMAGAVRIFGERADHFEQSYSKALDAVAALQLPTTVCTIYNGNFEPAEAEQVRIALRIFNDVILRHAFLRAFNVIELRLVCTRPEDFANPIEPSGPGGLKIAKAIVRSLGLDGVSSPASRVTVG